MTQPALDLPRLDLGLADFAESYDVILCDVWGVIHNGARHHPAAVDALRRYRRGGGTVILVTNAPAPCAQVIRRLDSLDVPRDAYDDVATSGDVTTALIVEAGCPPIFNIGPDGDIAIYREAARLGPRTPERVGIDQAALAICIGPDDAGDRPEDYDATLRQLKDRDLELICANPDIVVEVGNDLVYCAGAIAERYAAMGGKVTQAGKPFPAIYDRAIGMAEALRRATPRQRVLAIGDAMHTDITGARNQGFAALFVTAGIHRAALHREEHGGVIDREALMRLFADYCAQPLAALPGLKWALSD